jgi:hypothetical protein
LANAPFAERIWQCATNDAIPSLSASFTNANGKASLATARTKGRPHDGAEVNRTIRSGSIGTNKRPIVGDVRAPGRAERG